MIFLNNSIKNTGGHRQQFAHVAGESAQGPGCSGEHWFGPHNGLKVKCPLIGSCTWIWGSRLKVLSGEEVQPYWRKNVVGGSLEALELDLPSCFTCVLPVWKTRDQPSLDSCLQAACSYAVSCFGGLYPSWNCGAKWPRSLLSASDHCV